MTAPVRSITEGAADAARTMKLQLVSLATALALLGCDEDDREQDREEEAMPRFEAADLRRELADLEGAARLERFPAGVVVTGEVAQVMDLADMGGYRLRLDAGGGARILVRFADEGGAAKAREIDKGDELTVRCQLGGTAEGHVTLRDCTLAE